MIYKKTDGTIVVEGDLIVQGDVELVGNLTVNGVLTTVDTKFRDRVLVTRDDLVKALEEFDKGIPIS